MVDIPVVFQHAVRGIPKPRCERRLFARFKPRGMLLMKSSIQSDMKGVLTDASRIFQSHLRSRREPSVCADTVVSHSGQTGATCTATPPAPNIIHQVVRQTREGYPPIPRNPCTISQIKQKARPVQTIIASPVNADMTAMAFLFFGRSPQRRQPLVILRV
jgi:hypothetical protein